MFLFHISFFVNIGIKRVLTDVLEFSSSLYLKLSGIVESLLLFSSSSGSNRFHCFGHGQDKGGQAAAEVRHERADCGCALHSSHSPRRSSCYWALWAPTAAETEELSLWWASQTQFISIFLRYVKSDIQRFSPASQLRFVVIVAVSIFTFVVALFTQMICISLDCFRFTLTFTSPTPVTLSSQVQSCSI